MKTAFNFFTFKPNFWGRFGGEFSFDLASKPMKSTERRKTDRDQHRPRFNQIGQFYNRRRPTVEPPQTSIHYAATAFLQQGTGQDRVGQTKGPPTMTEVKEGIDRAARLGELLVLQTEHIAVLEEQLREAKAAALKLAREDLPELMRELGLQEFTLKSGQRIEVKEDVQCGISEANKPRAMRWLLDHGFGGLIKAQVTVEFGRGDIDAAAELVGQLAGQELQASLVDTVHPATLKSFVNEQLAKGNTIPFDLFGVFPFNFAKITTPKAARSKK